MIYHGTSKYSAAKIKKEGFNFEKGRVKTRSRMYGNAVSFTDSLELARRFGNAIIEVDLLKVFLFSMQKEPIDEEKPIIGKFLRDNYYDGIVFDDKKWGIKCKEFMIFNLDKIIILS